MTERSTYGNGRVSVELEAAYYRGWLNENSYGLIWCGPLADCPGPAIIDFVILEYMPGSAERARIEAAYADCRTPDGKLPLDYPDLAALERKARRATLGIRRVK